MSMGHDSLHSGHTQHCKREASAQNGGTGGRPCDDVSGAPTSSLAGRVFDVKRRRRGAVLPTSDRWATEAVVCAGSRFTALEAAAKMRTLPREHADGTPNVGADRRADEPIAESDGAHNVGAYRRAGERVEEEAEATDSEAIDLDDLAPPRKVQSRALGALDRDRQLNAGTAATWSRRAFFAAVVSTARRAS